MVGRTQQLTPRRPHRPLKRLLKVRHHPPLHHLGRVFVEAQPLGYARQLLLDSDGADQSDALKSNHSHSQYFGSLIRSRAPGCSKSPYRPPEYRGQSSANPASIVKPPFYVPLPDRVSGTGGRMFNA